MLTLFHVVTLILDLYSVTTEHINRVSDSPLSLIPFHIFTLAIDRHIKTCSPLERSPFYAECAAKNFNILFAWWVSFIAPPYSRSYSSLAIRSAHTNLSRCNSILCDKTKTHRYSLVMCTLLRSLVLFVCTEHQRIFLHSGLHSKDICGWYTVFSISIGRAQSLVNIMIYLAESDTYIICLITSLLSWPIS